MRYIFIVFSLLTISACATQSATTGGTQQQTGRDVTFKTYHLKHSSRPLYYPENFYSNNYQMRYNTAKGWWNQ